LDKKKSSKRAKQPTVKGAWSKDEDNTVSTLVSQYGPKRWSLIASNLPGTHDSSLAWLPHESRASLVSVHERACRASSNHSNATSLVSPIPSNLAPSGSATLAMQASKQMRHGSPVSFACRLAYSVLARTPAHSQGGLASSAGRGGTTSSTQVSRRRGGRTRKTGLCLVLMLLFVASVPHHLVLGGPPSRPRTHHFTPANHANLSRMFFPSSEP